jgi:hypothetical protein
MLILFTLFYSVMNKIILPQISKVLKIRKKILQFYVDSTRELYLESISALEFNIKMIDTSLGEALDAIQSTIKHDVGVIAQEIESILPEAVTTRDSGYKAVNYEKIVPLLIEAVKALTIKVEKLESK